jgi:hypothetical protein
MPAFPDSTGKKFGNTEACLADAESSRNACEIEAQDSAQGGNKWEQRSTTHITAQNAAS